jgi:hypothetical protein
MWRVTRRRQIRHHYRIPTEVAGVVDGTLVRVVDLTPGGAGIIGPRAIEVGTQMDLRLDLPSTSGEIRAARVTFTVRSCQACEEPGWRMGGTLVPDGQADAEVLFEHCYVVSSRHRLTEAGRLAPAGVAAKPGTVESVRTAGTADGIGTDRAPGEEAGPLARQA